MKVQTKDLIDAALDWAANTADGSHEYAKQILRRPMSYILRPSTSWEQGGPIIESERIHLCPIIYNDAPAWDCWIDDINPQRVHFYGLTPLIAAMRCFVASKLGDEVDIPEELLP